MHQNQSLLNMEKHIELKGYIDGNGKFDRFPGKMQTKALHTCEKYFIKPFFFLFTNLKNTLLPSTSGCHTN